jgi:nucleotide-binding universal stress UspA family protein
MKTILLYVHDDAGGEARLQAALDLARAHDGHVTCLQATPLAAYVAGDFFGGAYVMPDLLDAVNEHERKLRAGIEARLSRENVSWSYEHADGQPAATIVARAGLADVVVLSRCVRLPKPNQPEPLAGDVAVHASTPVLAVPPDAKGFDACGAAVVAWNGGVEAANALKAAMPMLRQATAINVVTVGEEDEDGAFPATDACEYLARYGLKPELHEVVRHGRPVGDRLLDTLDAIGGDYLVMGAYGHSRAREFVLGGVTRRMLADCPVPLLLAH